MLHGGGVIQACGAARQDLQVLRDTGDDVVPNGYQATLPIGLSRRRDSAGWEWFSGRQFCSQALGRTER
jgi:hypothetical protein